MSYQEHQQENHKNGCYDASQDGEFVEHDDEPSQENRQRGNEDERNRGSNGRTINRKISDQWTRCKRKLTRNSTCSTTVEIWNLINKTSVDEARIHILYCPRPWCLRFVPLIGKSRLVGCNISNILPSNGHEVSEETQRHTTRAPSDTRLAPVDFNFDTIVVARRVLALDSRIQIEHWDKIRTLCVTIEPKNYDLSLPPQAINRLSQLSLFANTLMISPSTIFPGQEGFGNFTFLENGYRCTQNLELARAFEEQLATRTTIRHVVIASVAQHDLKWYHDHLL